MGSQGELVPAGLKPLSIKRRTGVSEEVMAEEEEPLSPAARLMHEPQFNCYIIAVLGSRKPLNLDLIKAGLNTTIVHHPRFSSILVRNGGRPRWVRRKVVLDDHLVEPDLDPAIAATSPDKLLEDYIAALSTAAPLDPSRPLWELHFLHLRTSDAEAAAIFRIHHSLGDGVSLISFFLACTRQCSNPDALPTLPTSHRPPPRLPFPRRALATVSLGLNTLVDVLHFTATTLFLRDTDTPLRTSRFGTRPMRIVHGTISLDDLKSVKNAMHCTINDVLVGVMSAGLSRYLDRSYTDGLPNNIRFRTTLIFNIRPTPGIPALAKMMEGGNGSGNARWGNALGYAMLPLPIGTCRDDPLDYVRKGKKIADRKKKSLEAFFSHNVVTRCHKMFGIKAAARLCHRVFRQTTLTLSNVVGPTEEIEFYGHPMVYLVPGVFGFPHPLTVHFQSYMNKMEIVLSVDEMVVPDPHKLLEDLAESLKLIKDSALARS